MNILSYFPYDSFRPNQKQVLLRIQKYFDSGIEVVVIDGPTGFGKSPVNICAGRCYAPAFYTTPQVSLIEQLAADFGPKKLMIDAKQFEPIVPLLARRRYICRKSNDNSEDCKERLKDVSCSKIDECTYWKQKEGVFNAEIGILTFANLIINRQLPDFIESEGEEKQISFTKRKLLIVDECHNLEEQVASLHAGFSISPYDVNGKHLRKKMWEQIGSHVPTRPGKYEYDKLIPFLEKTKEFCENAEDYIQSEAYFQDIIYESDAVDKNKNVSGIRAYISAENIKNLRKIHSIEHKIEYMMEEIKEGRHWIVNINEINYKKGKICRPEFKPIRVDRFLREHIWWYGEKYLLTSATIPFRNNIERWLKRIGLGDKTYRLIQVPMLFPIENRPIYLDFIGGTMNYSNREANWTKNVIKVKKVLDKYDSGVKGVIHTSSFDFAFRLYDELQYQYSVYLHNKEELDGETVITAWFNSGNDILLSPSVYEGVSLDDDLCRFQILFKVPYGSLNDGRVDFLLNKNKDWNWYNNEAITKVIQAYGRGVRHMKDYADFYIIDGSFNKLKSKFPPYFKEAIVRKKIRIEVNK